MKHTIPDSLYVSSNFGPRRRGGRSAAAASRAKKSAITSAQSKDEFLANDGEELSSQSTGSPANKPKRRDAKSTPPSHNATKAKELAGRKVGLSKGEADPVADLPRSSACATSSSVICTERTVGPRRCSAEKKNCINFPRGNLFWTKGHFEHFPCSPGNNGGVAACILIAPARVDRVAIKLLQCKQEASKKTHTHTHTGRRKTSLRLRQIKRT